MQSVKSYTDMLLKCALNSVKGQSKYCGSAFDCRSIGRTIDPAPGALSIQKFLIIADSFRPI